MISFFDYFAQVSAVLIAIIPTLLIIPMVLWPFQLEKKLQETHEYEALLAEAKQRAEHLATLVDKTVSTIDFRT